MPPPALKAHFLGRRQPTGGVVAGQRGFARSWPHPSQTPSPGCSHHTPLWSLLQLSKDPTGCHGRLGAFLHPALVPAPGSAVRVRNPGHYRICGTLVRLRSPASSKPSSCADLQPPSGTGTALSPPDAVSRERSEAGPFRGPASDLFGAADSMPHGSLLRPLQGAPFVLCRYNPRSLWDPRRTSWKHLHLRLAVDQHLVRRQQLQNRHQDRLYVPMPRLRPSPA